VLKFNSAILDKELLKSVIFDQQSLSWDEGNVKRIIPSAMDEGEEITVISGVRRCGKSTLLHQIRSGRMEHDYYLNLDDERLVNFQIHDFQLLYETFIELFGLQKTFYFDEIQNVSGWERFVRRLHDHGNKVFVTGSNATMLSRELGTHLTGRYSKIELYPFSFTEFLQFNQKTLKPGDISSTRGRSELKRFFSEYLVNGGFPAYLKNRSEVYLKSLYESILYRDVMVRNKLTNERELLELVNYLASNVSRLASYNSLAKIAGVKNATTIKNYLGFLQNTYVLFQVNKFDYALKKQLHNSKKIYFIDNALAGRLGFNFSNEQGRMLENLVFLELQRRGHEVFYHSHRHECDFIIRDGTRITVAIQVCFTLDSAETREREIRGLMDAMQQYDLKDGFIITSDAEEVIEMNDRTIHILPAWKWTLEKSV